ncbi:hypothetical protein HDV63DRAFT_18010 [Trichoderma sp. SZMC 28014]
MNALGLPILILNLHAGTKVESAKPLLLNNFLNNFFGQQHIPMKGRYNEHEIFLVFNSVFAAAGSLWDALFRNRVNSQVGIPARSRI